MADRARRDAARRRREHVATTAARETARPGAAHDDTLALVFMCCHPTLTPSSAIALTLRAVGSLTTAQIAAAFLVPEATMAQRISRAKQRIESSGVPFRMPAADEWGQRLRAVLHVLYLIHNEGYLTSDGPDLVRPDLSAEAIRLARMVRGALPDDPEVGGLLALMLLTEARRTARIDEHGQIVTLDAQDRSRWNGELIAEGTALIAEALRRGSVGEYQLQAAIAAAHDRAARAADTDWGEILGLYGLLEQVTGNPMVALNRAIATAMVDGPTAGLAALEPLADRLAGHHRLHAVRAHLLEMAGDPDAALAEYGRAAARTASIPEQRYLHAQAARLHARPADG